MPHDSVLDRLRAARSHGPIVESVTLLAGDRDAIITYLDARLAVDAFLHKGHDGSVSDRVRYSKEEHLINKAETAALAALTEPTP